ncbi:unnamed protein product [Durusdinium trenchii]|uniref:Uncharacterized protein n=1 Tax=Durusdinium trenchii TaxID=1381693 RepID=A0ABP0JNG6_9DINO
MAERENVAEEEQKAEGALEEDKNDIEAAEKTLRDTADSKLKEEKEKEPEEMEKKTAKKKTTLTTMPSPKQDIFSDPLRAAEESDLLKAVGTTDPFGAEEEKAEKQEWIADFPDR